MNRDNRFALLLTGLGVGAAAGFMLARCSGSELRKEIRKSVGNAKDFLQDQAETLADRVENATGVVTDAAGDLLDKTSALAHRASKLMER